MKKILTLGLSGLPSYMLARARMRFFRRSPEDGARVQKILLGRSVALDASDLEQEYLIKDCVREPENVFLYTAVAKGGLADVFVDVGANCGHVALQVFDTYKNLVLIDANPNAIEVLRSIFGAEEKVTFIHAALVNDSSIEFVDLKVPEGSSGLGSIVHDESVAGHTYHCKASTLDAVLESQQGSKIYVKIDVEGAEPSVIEGGLAALDRLDPVVGFEALSKEAAIESGKFFTDHTFYFGRFGFLDRSGALTQSIPGLLGALITGGSIDIYKTDDLQDLEFDNFSQLVAVRRSKTAAFEVALAEHAKNMSNTIALRPRRTIR